MTHQMTPRLPRPHLVFLWKEIPLRRLFSEVFQLEGYTVEAAQTADEAIFRLERAGGLCLVLMDNFIVNPEAFRLVTQLTGKPALRMRIKLIGTDAISGIPGKTDRDLYELDGHIPLPPTVDHMLDTMERLWARLQAESPSRN